MTGNAIREALEPGTRWHHKKRGHTYEVVGVGRMQAEDWFTSHWQFEGVSSVDMQEAVIYRDRADGPIWVRPVSEFLDGRFELLPRTVYDAIGSGVPPRITAAMVKAFYEATEVTREGSIRNIKEGLAAAISCLSTHTAAGAGPVAWRVDNLTATGKTCGDFVLYASYERVEVHLQKHGARSCKVTPLYTRPVEYPGEVERLTRELAFERAATEDLQRAYDDLDVKERAAEAALTEARERLEKVEAAAGPIAEIADEYSSEEDNEHQVWKDFDALGASLPLKRFRALRAALTGDAQEAGR